MGLAAGFLHQFSEVFKIRDAEGQPSIPICLCPQIRTSLGWSESFDGITEHGARHVGMVSSEKALQHCLISLCRFPGTSTRTPCASGRVHHPKSRCVSFKVSVKTSLRMKANVASMAIRRPKVNGIARVHKAMTGLAGTDVARRCRGAELSTRVPIVDPVPVFQNEADTPCFS